MKPLPVTTTCSFANSKATLADYDEYCTGAHAKKKKTHYTIYMVYKITIFKLLACNLHMYNVRTRIHNTHLTRIYSAFNSSIHTTTLLLWCLVVIANDGDTDKLFLNCMTEVLVLYVVSYY
jgi:hypothetical protein